MKDSDKFKERITQIIAPGKGTFRDVMELITDMLECIEKMEVRQQAIYNYVEKMENLNYNTLKGNGSNSDILLSLNASCYQKVRYFIEILEERKNETI